MYFRWYSILYNAYEVCKQNDHDWYCNVINYLNENGLSYISNNPKVFLTNYIFNNLEDKLEAQYIQNRYNKSNSSDKLNIVLYNFVWIGSLECFWPIYCDVHSRGCKPYTSPGLMLPGVKFGSRGWEEVWIA